ncbi:hypothetical protein JAAARDRAFT_492692 [Jaapia argillacea MUCL 33604]|uniref:Uncharacterized protein n=1 Tax=Jaapia argillacea MUCL 33604 TaxID=933084 RepID=A0A067PNS5_9AGAM|nr:hypothetical protein JAAARDRAFT_492692 [Jaapia argillacea MUCL 33604]
MGESYRRLTFGRLLIHVLCCCSLRVFSTETVANGHLLVQGDSTRTSIDEYLNRGMLDDFLDHILASYEPHFHLSLKSFHSLATGSRLALFPNNIPASIASQLSVR